MFYFFFQFMKNIEQERCRYKHVGIPRQQIIGTGRSPHSGGHVIHLPFECSNYDLSRQNKNVVVCKIYISCRLN